MCLTPVGGAPHLNVQSQWTLYAGADRLRLTHWRILLVAWMAAIYLVSSDLLASRFSADATEEVLGLLNYAARKLAHMTEFGILMFLWFRSIHVSEDRFGARVVLSLVLTIAYAVTDELHQSTVAQRLGIWTDVLWDAAGALAVAFALLRVRRAGPPVLTRLVLGPTCPTRDLEGEVR